MVTIGCVDGGTHLVTLLNISNNNRSTTALRGFVQAVRKHGVPSRLRIDRGGYRSEVSIWSRSLQISSI